MHRRRRLAAALLVAGVLALLLGGGPIAPGRAEDGPPQPEQVYVRTPGDVDGCVRFLELEAERLGATQVMVAFDAPTFDPPPGLTEFSLEYPFFSDLPRWLAALEAWGARATCRLRGTSSLAPRSVDLREPGAGAKLDVLVHSRWWEGERPGRLPDAAQWMSEILARTEDAVRAEDPHPVRMLVLVAGGVTPERWVRADPDKGYESEWRGKLAPVGEYFQEGRVAAALERQGCRLYVVAPEARFGDFAPFVELPELPWAARPHLPGDDLRLSAGALGPATRAGRPGLGLREALDESLRGDVPDPEERRRIVEELLRRRSGGGGPGGDTPPPTTPSLPGVPGISTRTEDGLRFLSTTPVWFRRMGGTLPYNNHAPSGYGAWPYARAAARTGGRYVFYPFPDSEWLDLCPANGALLNELAPELVSRQVYVAARRGDPALAAVARAASLVFDDTPWSDTWYQQRASRSWTSFTRTSPLALERHCWQRRKPYDDALQGTERGLERLGERLEEDVLPRYDRALALLDDAARRLRPGQDGVHPRAHANLLLTRFWFRMSAFHLHAYALYARELERFVPESMKGRVERVVVTYVPTIRMSDCLDAYDGRELDLAGEAQYPRWVPGDAPGYQGNLLEIPERSPDYRARRRIASVLRHLDRRLHVRALAMIEAGRDVMASYAQTGWGWTTYYSDAYTFVFEPVELRRGPNPSRGGGKPPPRPTTPRGGGNGGGGSKGGGPSTGG